MVVQLHQIQDLKQLLQKSNSDPVIIFKHSTQCPVSAEAYDEFIRFTERAPGVTAGLVLVIEDRDVSNAIASTLGIRHQSPQAIVVKNGEPIWSTSHWSITADSLAEGLQK
jgi:bacillithiol system protein YtxJ